MTAEHEIVSNVTTLMDSLNSHVSLPTGCQIVAVTASHIVLHWDKIVKVTEGSQ